jgi:AcrR family transcriptional regulator
MARPDRPPEDPASRRAVKTPRAELEKIRNQQTEDAEVRARIMEAMLLCTGELGYRRVAVRHVYQRYGGYRTQFYRHFANKAECFAAAYQSEVDHLSGRLLAFVRAEGQKAERLEAALGDLVEFVSARPTVARAIFIEVHVAGEEARSRRTEAVTRLAAVIDETCRRTKAGPSPPPTAGQFVVGAVEQAVASSLLKSDQEELLAAIPELTAIFGDIYSSGDG